MNGLINVWHHTIYSCIVAGQWVYNQIIPATQAIHTSIDDIILRLPALRLHEAMRS